MGYRFTSPDLYVPRSSIFSVFSEETYQEAGIDARWQATRALSLEAGYGLRFYNAAADGRAGADYKNRASVRSLSSPLVANSSVVHRNGRPVSTSTHEVKKSSTFATICARPIAFA